MKFDRIKNILPIIFFCSTTLFFPINASADVLFGKAYYQILHKYLIQSKSSITERKYRGQALNVEFNLPDKGTRG